VGRTQIPGVKNGVVHAVQEVHGDNFNFALCGKKPSSKSLGWYLVSKEINCPKCLEKIKYN